MPDRQRIRGGWPVKSVYPRFNDFRVASYRAALLFEQCATVVGGNAHT